jgi:hypothetical protein
VLPCTLIQANEALLKVLLCPNSTQLNLRYFEKLTNLFHNFPEAGANHCSHRTNSKVLWYTKTFTPLQILFPFLKLLDYDRVSFWPLTLVKQSFVPKEIWQYCCISSTNQDLIISKCYFSIVRSFLCWTYQPFTQHAMLTLWYNQLNK